LVSERDLVRFRDAGRPELAEQIAPGHFSEHSMALDAAGACVHLGQPGKPNHCSIYEIRPDICGEFAVGCPQCLAARRAAGIAPANPTR
jgi:Fe-S-cluster containining protein